MLALHDPKGIEDKIINNFVKKIRNFFAKGSKQELAQIGGDNLEVQWLNNIAVVKMPEVYWVGSWGPMLELVRSGKVKDASDIIVDFSNVKSIGDGSSETYILRKEFREVGGGEVVHVGMPPEMIKMYELMMNDKLTENERISDFDRVEDALEYLASHIK